MALLATSALAPACAAAGGAVLVALLQGGGLHLVPLGFDPRRLDPVSGLKRMLGAEAAVAAARAVLAFVLALAAMLPLATEALAGAAHLGAPLAAAALVGRAALGACAAAFAVGAVFAFGDAALARRRWLHGLRMSFDEIKRDAKEHDGDPHARARRTRLHRAVVRGAIARTREASFVVVNPTHVAVALRYAPPQVPVPEILVRARDEGALCVRALAKQCAIPVVEDAALARLLYAQGESGSAIPVETYVAVAQAIASLARAGLLS
ncbi:MAG: EscU/YscU/HrcU family type III secretion system export apparatus switch protein [Candidatus Eremiobacteraeota bacterium]|nr:EscU/YscU/HrcU family type III secretion system export apparatus switch protein [Candidatus Eremiobacteraeota bacterium]